MLKTIIVLSFNYLRVKSDIGVLSIVFNTFLQQCSNLLVPNFGNNIIHIAGILPSYYFTSCSQEVYVDVYVYDLMHQL